MEPKKAKRAKIPSRISRPGLVNDQLLRITDSLPVLIAYIDSQQRTLFNNKAYEEWFGVSWENLKGKPISEHFGPAYSKIKKYVNRVLSGKKVGFEVSLDNQKGESRSIYAQYIPDLEGPGKVNGFFVLAQDITEQKRNEALVRREGEQILSIFDGIDETIYVIDPQTYEVLYVNRAKKNEFSKELVGQKCFQALQGLEKPCGFCTNDRIFGKNLGKTYTWEWQNLKNKCWYRCHDKAIRWPDGRWVRYEMALDITEKKNMQAERIQADRLSTIGELAAGVAHEINNPINGIINYAQILLDQTRERGQEGEIPKRIIKEGERIASIVDNLLMFAKDRGEQNQPTPLFSLLNSVLDLVGTQIKKDGILVMIEVPEDLPPIIVKSQQIHQVFLNLISNARYALNRKYPGRHNKKILEIRGIRKAESKGPSWVEVSFYDQGIGIPPSLLDRVCDPFFSTKPPGEGTGLGLSISRSIIQDHGGRLGFESQDGEYTRAIVELPAAE